MFDHYIFEKYADNNAIVIADGTCITYRQLWDYSQAVSSVVPTRSLVFCLCDNKPGSIAGYVSFLSNKVVPLMLDSSIDNEMFQNLLSLYKPSYLWMPTDNSHHYPMFSRVLDVLDYSLMDTGFRSDVQLHDELALLLTTSGSTGSPKLVRLSYDNVKSNAVSIIEYLEIDETERPITSLPMNYSFGLSIINSHLLSGATLLLTSSSLMEKEFWALLKNEKATSISGVPYTFEMLKRLRFFRMDLPSLKTLTQAGGKFNAEQTKEFAEYCASTGKRFFTMYGQTEATARMSYLPSEQALDKLGSIGIAIPRGEFHLIDDAGNELNAIDVSGELVYKGPNVSLGYAETADDLAKGDENEGTLHTGDIAKKDADGYYYIVGRKKRFIKLFGNRVNLDETERLLKTQILDCACVGVDDKMVIYITELGREDEVKRYISTKMGINHTGFNVIYIQEIPKNSSGKTMYAKLDI